MPPPAAERKRPDHDDQKPIVPKPWKIPLLRLKVNDLSCDGATSFFNNVNAPAVLREAVVAVLEALYTKETQPKNIRSVTLVLRSMGGVAYTTGSEIDDDHKEIHFSTDYISNVDAERAKHEIVGVITHEMVHCWQYNGKGTCPGGLIEGIADWVRLRAGFSPPHWHRGGRKWDDGYQNTAYFLDWCEETIGAGFVPKLNAALKDRKYQHTIWKELAGGKTVKELWTEYKKAYNLDDEGGDDSEPDNDDADDQVACNLDGNDDVNDGEHYEKENSSEGEDGNVVGRNEVNDVSILEKSNAVADGAVEAEARIREAIILRHQIQKIFLTRDHIPVENQLTTANHLFEFLESHEISQTALEKSKLGKVMRLISKLAHPDVTDPLNSFVTRAQALAEKLGTRSKESTVKVSVHLNNDTIDKLNPAREIARQIEMPFNLSVLGATVEKAEAEVEVEEDDCGQSVVSTTQASIVQSRCSASCPSRGSLSSHGSTKRGRQRSSSSSSSNSSWRFSGTVTGRETQVAIIARKRLAALEFHGDIEGRRFMKQFEALIDRVDPEMSDDDKRLLLTACFKGEKVNEWYEMVDTDYSMAYEELKVALTNHFKGTKNKM